jgi:hypothetical protein
MTMWRTPALDGDAANAVALLTLCIDGSAMAVEAADRLLEEWTGGPDGASRAVGGLMSLCATLLALHEFDTGLPPDLVLRQAAVAVQMAMVGSDTG